MVSVVLCKSNGPVWFLLDDRIFKSWLGLLNRFSWTTVLVVSKFPCSSPCCLAHCSHFPGVKVRSQHLSDSTDTSPAWNFIIPFLGVGSTGAPYQTPALCLLFSSCLLSWDLPTYLLQCGTCPDCSTVLVSAPWPTVAQFCRKVSYRCSLFDCPMSF